MLKVAALVSRDGTLLQALIDGCKVGEIQAEIALVICNANSDRPLQRAAQAGISAIVIRHQDYPDRETFERELHRCLQEHGIDFVCLIQFNRLLTPWFVEQWRDRLINCHPSLLPAFKGWYTCSRALNAGVKFAGCTVHFVRPPMDEGPIIIQAVVPVLLEDTPATLRGRILKVEKRCFAQALQWIAAGRVRIENERVFVEGVDAPSQVLLNPCAE
ncbi:MAG: phosphoribosylglycinamide formyltransferase [Spirirestis rafaelensis WJT71-NPBG6]|jgi:phosphoribosylglycinamide formyltransferase-1|nr:phosphoribosylglycinamide formyltransferase [Spirirestis rafaelensis WJT71-NPBG6]